MVLGKLQLAMGSEGVNISFERFLTVVKPSPTITLLYIGVYKTSYARCSGAVSAHPVLFVEVVRRRSIISDHHPVL